MTPMISNRRVRTSSSSRSQTSANRLRSITSLNGKLPSGRSTTSPAYTSRSFFAPRWYRSLLSAIGTALLGSVAFSYTTVAPPRRDQRTQRPRRSRARTTGGRSIPHANTGATGSAEQVDRAGHDQTEDRQRRRRQQERRRLGPVRQHDDVGRAERDRPGGRHVQVVHEHRSPPGPALRVVLLGEAQIRGPRRPVDPLPRPAAVHLPQQERERQHQV